MGILLRSSLWVILCGVSLTQSFATSPGPARLIKDIHIGPNRSTQLEGSIDLNGQVLFYADDGVHGFEPWISDGTADGTHLLKDIFPGAMGSVSTVQFVPWHGRAYFIATEGVSGFELWSTDGTESGTRRVKDIYPGTGSSFPGFGTPLDSVFLFTADDGVHGHELWATDGTEGGTYLVKDIEPGPAGTTFFAATRLGNAVIFAGHSATFTLQSMWSTDGTEVGTLPLGLLPGDFDTLVVYQGALWFITPNDGFENSQLWKTDGTPAGTGHVADLAVFQAHSLTPAGGTLFFMGLDQGFGGMVGHRGLDGAASQGTNAGYELWASDGTGAGTRLVKDIWPGPLSSGAGNFTAVGDTLFFIARDPEHGLELWKSDGTRVGTVVVKDILPGTRGGMLGQLKNVDEILLFGADDSAVGISLWRSDGTGAGTLLVQDLPAETASSNPRGFLTFGRRVAFSAVEPSTGREPWVGRSAILTHQPARAIQDLADEVRSLGLPPRIERSLIGKLSAAGEALGRWSGVRAALRLLDAFESAVARNTPSSIADRDAENLLEFAEEIAGLLVDQQVRF